MDELLEKPVVVTYWYAKECIWSRQKRVELCRTKFDLQELRQLCKTKPNQFEIIEERELPC